FVMADIPGIIEDAHEGKGLGIQFLRHIERNNLLLFMVGSDSDIQAEYKALLNELKEYRPDLLDKPRILAITKMDLVEGYEFDEPLVIGDDVEVIEISSATGHQVDKLKETIWKKLQDLGEEEPS
ncbi:MAG: 50S ribosome-binding GTPase, partial [Balneolaceae bacterium]|nr:50S ribosome-binding GTPase [Balneolaceae bacterium]